MQIVDGLLLPSTFGELLESRFGPKASPNTDIYGSGYGYAHHWKQVGSRMYFGLDGLESPQIGGPTYYKCQQCGISFDHHYHDEPDIFEAIKQAGIPDKCTRLT